LRRASAHAAARAEPAAAPPSPQVLKEIADTNEISPTLDATMKDIFTKFTAEFSS